MESDIIDASVHEPHVAAPNHANEEVTPLATRYTLNIAAFRAAALLAGDTRKNGDPYIARVSRRTGLDQAVVSRVTRGKNAPDLRTVMAIACAYGLTVEQLVQADSDLQATA